MRYMGNLTSQFCGETKTALKNLVKTWTNGKKTVLSQEFCLYLYEMVNVN